MNVVPNVVNRKRKKAADSKPHSQLNKCLNEKRRREQENIYIEELAELISASISDMSSLSVKPDKCAILQETVNQIRRIKQQEVGQCDDLQQSEVSSSKPTILANDVLGPLLLEALDGFLFVVNTDGKIVSVSGNVTSFLKYSEDDLLGKSIYNIIHVGDHARFSSNLLPMSIGNGFGWTSEPSTGTSKSRSFNCRFLIKPPDDHEETMEEKQTRVSQYENMQVSAILLPYPGERADGAETDSEVQNCMICISRRISVNERSPTSVGVEQFTTRLDLTGKILAIDTSGVSSTYSQYLNKDLVGRIIQELCHPNDLQKLDQHLKEALQTGSNTSGIYRFRVSQEKFVHVQTKSKRFNYNQVTNEPEFIMATHSIIRDNENHPVEGNTVSSQRINSSPAPPLSVSPASSGPVPSSMSSNMNGMSGVASTTPTSMSSSATAYPGFPSLNSPTQDFNFDLSEIGMIQGSSWDLGSGGTGRDSGLGDGLTTSLPSTSMSSSVYAVVSSPTNQPTTASSTNGGAGSMLNTRTSQSSQSMNHHQQQPTSSAFSPDLMSGKVSPATRSPMSQLSSTSSPTPGRTTPFGNAFSFSPVQMQPQPSSGKTSPPSVKKSEDVSTPSLELCGLSPAASAPGLMQENQSIGRATHKLRNLLTQGIEEADSSPASSSYAPKPQAGDGKDVPSSSASDCDPVPGSRTGQTNSVDGMSALASSQNENNILRDLLNQEDEDLSDMSGKTSHRVNESAKGMVSTMSSTDMCKSEMLSEGQKKNNNNMLRKLLNDDDNEKNCRKPSDYLLIQQLLKADSQDKVRPLMLYAGTEAENYNEAASSGMGEVDSANRRIPATETFSLKQLGLESSPLSNPPTLQSSLPEAMRTVAKRKSPDQDTSDSTSDPASKRSMTTHHVSQHTAHLAGQNPLLASMLERTPRTVPPVPISIATSIVSQLPQERLPKNLEKKLVHTPCSGAPGGTSPTMTTTGGIPVSSPMSQQQRTAQVQSNRSLLVSSSIQQDVVTADSRGHVTMAHQPHVSSMTGVSTSTSVSSISQQTQQQPGFLNKILVGAEGSHLSRVLATPSGASALSSHIQQQQQSHQNAGHFTQFSQNSQQPTQTNAVASVGLPELLNDPSSLDSTNPTNQAGDPLLSEILDQVWSMQQEMNMESSQTDESMLLKILDEVLDPQVQSGPHSSTTLTQDLNEKMAISAIQRQLMSCEVPPNSSASLATSVSSGSVTLPLYSQANPSQSTAVGNTVLSQSQLSPNSLGTFSNSGPFQSGPPPPAYQGVQRPRGPIPGANMMANTQQLTLGIQRTALSHYGSNANAANLVSSLGGSPVVVRRPLLEKRQKAYLQQQQKRLLAQQKQQQLTMQTQQPISDGMVGPSFPENMNEMLNNTIAPNVTLQRAPSVPEQQLSPRYGQAMLGQIPSPVSQSPAPSQLSPGQRQQPQPQQPQPQPQPQPHHRLSPHPMQPYAQGGPGPTSSAQVPVSVGTGGPRSPHLRLSPQPVANQTQWNQRPTQSPVSGSLQQQNPMLNAQLSQQGSFANTTQGRFALQRQVPMRSLSASSAGSVSGSRNSSYPGQGDGPFPPQSPVSNVGLYQQQAQQQQQSQHQAQQPQTQQQRLQRAISMPGRVNSPRTQPGGYIASDPLLSPQPQMSPGYSQSIPSTPVSSYPGSGHSVNASATSYNIAQESTHFSFDQQNIQLFPSTPADRGRGGTGVAVSSEYVRQELRAMVGARTQQQQVQSQQQPQQQGQLQQGLHQLRLSAATPPQGHPSSNQTFTQADLDALGLSLEVGPGDSQPSSPGLFNPSLLNLAGGQDPSLQANSRSTNSPRLAASYQLLNQLPGRSQTHHELKWGRLPQGNKNNWTPYMSNMRDDDSHNTTSGWNLDSSPQLLVEDVRPNDQKKSLLQQLLSEPT